MSDQTKDRCPTCENEDRANRSGNLVDRGRPCRCVDRWHDVSPVIAPQVSYGSCPKCGMKLETYDCPRCQPAPIITFSEIVDDGASVGFDIDGDKWCANRLPFTNMMEMPCGFGDTPMQALAALLKEELTVAPVAPAVAKEPKCESCGNILFVGHFTAYCHKPECVAKLEYAASLSQALVDAAIRERDAWEETASQFCRNQDFYRGLLVRIGDMFGVAAKTSDDGSVQQDVLAPKVPELVASLQDELERVTGERDSLKICLHSMQDGRIAAERSLETAREALKSVRQFRQRLDNDGCQISSDTRHVRCLRQFAVDVDKLAESALSGEGK